MFLTRSSYEHPVGPVASGHPDGKGWLLCNLSAEMPWWLVTYSLEDDEASWSETVLIWRDQELIDVVQQVRRSARGLIRFVGRVLKDERNRWTMKEIVELWLGSPEEPSHRSCLLYVPRHDRSFFDTLDNEVEVEAEWPGRELLQWIPESES